MGQGHTKTPVIAIDGPAGSGKGTLARSLATHLGYAHLDTGKLYRAVALIMAQEDHPSTDQNAAYKAAIHLAHTDDLTSVLNNPALLSDKIGNAASQIAEIPQVRAALTALQRNFARTPGKPHKGAVLDGRDIGTVICTDADVKFFVTAAVDIRAERRRKELHSRGVDVTYEAVLKDMHARDQRDAKRETAPMTLAKDAIVLDTGQLTAEQALEKALDYVKRSLT